MAKKVEWQLPSAKENKFSEMAKRLGIEEEEMIPLAMAHLEATLDKYDEGYKWAIVKEEHGIQEVDIVQFQWMDEDGLGTL